MILKLASPKFNSLIICSIYSLLILCIPQLASTQNIQRPPILGITKVTLKVSNTNKALQFYKELLGYNVIKNISTNNHSST